jgi:hypothetical protein
MTTRKRIGKKAVEQVTVQYALLTDWRARFLPNSHASETTTSRKEDPEQLAARLVRETLASLRPKTGT